MTRIGHPFQGVIFYGIETSYGGGFVANTERAVSKEVQDVRVGSGDRHAKLMGFDSPLVKELMEQTKEPVLHVEYFLQAADSLVTDSVNRVGSCCTLESLAFEVQSNACSVIASEKSYFYFTGCKANTIKIAATKNSPYTITLDYLAKSVVTAASGATDPGTTLLGNVCAFNIAGSIRRGAAANLDVAYCVNSIDIDFNNNLEGHTDHDDLEKTYLVEGELAVSGTIDITLNDGGGVHMGEVLTNDPFALRVKTSDATGAEGDAFVQIDLPGCKWNLSEIDQNVGGSMMMESAPFTCVPSSCTDMISRPTL